MTKIAFFTFSWSVSSFEAGLQVVAPDFPTDRPSFANTKDPEPPMQLVWEAHHVNTEINAFARFQALDEAGLSSFRAVCVSNPSLCHPYLYRIWPNAGDVQPGYFNALPVE